MKKKETLDEDVVFYRKYKPKISLNNPTTVYGRHRERLITSGNETTYYQSTTNKDLLKGVDYLNATYHSVMDEDVVFYRKYKPEISLNNPTTIYRRHRERLLSRKMGQEKK